MPSNGDLLYERGEFYEKRKGSGEKKVWGGENVGRPKVKSWSLFWGELFYVSLFILSVGMNNF